MKQPAKSEMKWQIANLQAELKQRRSIGGQMAILCLIFSRRKVDAHKDIAQELHKQWNAITRAAGS